MDVVSENGDPQVTMGFNAQMVVHDLDILGYTWMILGRYLDDLGYPGTPHDAMLGKLLLYQEYKTRSKKESTRQPVPSPQSVGTSHKGCFEIFCSHGHVSIFSPFMSF